MNQQHKALDPNPVNRERQLRAQARRKGLFLIRLTGAARGDNKAPYAIIPKGGTITLEQATIIIEGRSQ